MHAKRKNINKATILSKTHFNKDIIKHTLSLYEKFKKDPEKEQRYKEQECLVCYYRSGRVGGSVVTSTECGKCETLMHFGNTCVDVLCKKCAKELRLCKHCGGDIDCKNRRNREI